MDEEVPEKVDETTASSPVAEKKQKLDADRAVHFIESQLESVWKHVLEQANPERNDLLTSVDVQTFLEKEGCKYTTNEDAEEFCAMVNLKANLHTVGTEVDDDVILDREHLSKDTFLKLVKADCFGKEKWDDMADLLFNRFIERGDRTDSISADVFLDICREHGENSTKEDIMSLFCNLLSVNEHEYAMDELYMTRKMFKDLVFETLKTQLHISGVKERVLRGMKATEYTGKYDVKFDRAKGRYVEAGKAE